MYFGNWLSTGTTATDSDWRMYSVRHDPQGSVSVYANGALITSDVGSNYVGPNGLQFNEYDPEWSYFKLAELVVFNRSLTLAQLQQVEGTLMWKFGLQSKLPSDHMYAASSPVPFFVPTPSNTATGTPTPTRTATPTRSYSYLQAFQPSSFLLLRYEYVASGGERVSVPAYIEEWSLSGSTPSLLQTVSLPLSAYGSNLACTVFAHTGQGYSLARSKKGTYVTLPCIGNLAPQRTNTLSSYPPASYPRVIARLYPNGTIDTSQYCNDCYSQDLSASPTYPILFSAVADESLTPNRYWITGNSRSDGGVRTVSHNTRSSTLVAQSSYSTPGTDG